MIIDNIIGDIETLWAYLCVGAEPIKSECVIGLGSILTLIPKRCAELFRRDLAEYIVFSGNCGNGTRGVINISEAERFKAIAIEEGIPEEKIITESRATTTYDNFKYTNDALKARNLDPNTIMVVGKPYQERRARAIADVQSIGRNYRVVSLGVALQEYLDFAEKDAFMSVEDTINEMVGEMSLIIRAPKYGLQSAQEVPEKVMNSFRRIVAFGYDKYNRSDNFVRNLARNTN